MATDVKKLEKALAELESTVALWLQGKTTNESTLWHIRDILKSLKK